MATEPKKRGRKPKSAAGKPSVSITQRFDPAIIEAVDKFIVAQRLRTDRTAVFEAAVKELLKGEGFWPK